MVQNEELESGEVEVVLDHLDRKEKCKAGVQGEKGNVGLHGPTDEQGAQGGVRGEQGECGAKGEKGIQGDNSDVRSVLAEHLPIQLVTRFGEKMCFIK